MITPPHSTISPYKVLDLKGTFPYVLSIIFVIIGLILPLILLGRGIYPIDEYYQIFCSWDYLNQPVWPLTAAVGHGWASLTGEHAYNYRILSYLFYSITILAGCIFYWRHTGKMIAAAFSFMILQILWTGYKALIWGWYVPSDCMLALTCYAAIQYITRPNRLLLICIGVFSACATMSRLPSIAIIPVVCILLICSGRSLKKIVLCIVEYLFYTFLTILIILILIYGNPIDYFHVWNSDNVITGHSGNPLIMFLRPLSESLLHDTEVYTALFTGVGLLWLGKRIHPSSMQGPSFLWCVATTIILFVILRINFIYSFSNFGNIVNYYYVTFFFLMGMAILIPYLGDGSKKPDKNYWLIWLIIIACSLCGAVGSDRSIRNAVCFPLFPAIILIIDKLKSPCAKSSLTVIAIAFVILIPFIKEKIVGYDKGLQQLTSEITTIPSMNGIYTTKENEAFLRETTDAIVDVEKSKSATGSTLILGTGRYSISYALGRKVVDLQKYHQDVESYDFVKNVASHLAGSDTKIVTYIVPPGKNEPSKSLKTPSGMCNLLKSNGFELYKVTSYADIWIKH